MKILQIGQFPMNVNFIKGGVEASVYGIAKVMSFENDVYVIDIPRYSISHDIFEVVDGLKVYRYKSRFKSIFLSFTIIPRTLKTIKTIQPDICHLHSTSLYSLILTLFLDVNKLKRVLTIHGLVHVEKKQLLKNAFSIKKLFQYYYQSLTEFILISRSKLVIVDTKYVKEAVEKYKIENKITKIPQIKIIPQGVRDQFFMLGKPELSNVSQIISIGTFNERKGHLLLIEAFYEIQKSYTKINLAIIGVKSDLNYYEKLVDKITEFNLKDSIQLLTDVDNDTLINHLKTSQIFTLHTREESQGIVFCEAMACGLPIVTTNVGGVGDVLTDEENGLLSDYGDIENYKRNLMRIIEDYRLRNDMSCNNVIKSQNFNWKNIALQTIDVYHSVK